MGWWCLAWEERRGISSYKPHFTKDFYSITATSIPANIALNVRFSWANCIKDGRMLALDSYGRALLAIPFGAGDTQRCSSATADSRLDFCLPSSLSGCWAQKLMAGDTVPAAGRGCCHHGSSHPESSAG